MVYSNVKKYIDSKIDIVRSTPKLGYFMYKNEKDSNKIYYFEILEVTEKRIKVNYIIVDLNKVKYNVYTYKKLKRKQTLDGKIVNDYIKTYDLPYINMKDLIPDENDMFNKIRYGGLKYL